MHGKSQRNKQLIFLAFSVFCFLAGSISPAKSYFFFFYIGILWLCYGIMLRNKQLFSDWQYLLLGLCSHLVLFVHTPNLSPDVYRFILDGLLINKGVSPYIHVPLDLPTNLLVNQAELLEKCSSLSIINYSCYPPVNQLFFAFVAAIAGPSIPLQLFMYRCLMLVFTLGSAMVLRKILTYHNQDKTLAWLYFVNPLLIIEVSGNLHFEGIIVFFLLTAYYQLTKNRYSISAVMFGVAASIKLLPLILLPVILFHMSLHRRIKYSLIVCSVVFIPLIFLPSNQLEHLFSSIFLWINQFEFNASLYYIARYIGYQLMGYNLIEINGKILSVLSFVGILAISLFRKWSLKDLPQAFLFIYFVYFLCSTTIHPWYILVPLSFSFLTRNKVYLLWSFLMILSYLLYLDLPKEIKTILLFTEYGILFTYIYSKKSLFTTSFPS